MFGSELDCLPGEAHISVDTNVTPTISPTRRVPEALKKPLKTELKRMVEQKVIAPVDQPTPWVSNVLVTTKKTGELRVCIDPRPLNKALKREHYQLPVLDDILPELTTAKVFSSIDLKSGNWHVILDEESSMLITFSTPSGRYRWLRLPFGISVSSEIFQKKLLQAIGDLQGVMCIADDIVLYVGIRINKDKLKLRKEEISFHGHLVTKMGLKLDPAKVEALQQMPPLTDMQGVQRLAGFVNYLARFLPRLSDVMRPIQQLTKKDVPWNWTTPQEEAFREVKRLISAAPVLRYHDANKELTIRSWSCIATSGETCRFCESSPIRNRNAICTNREDASDRACG